MVTSRRIARSIRLEALLEAQSIASQSIFRSQPYALTSNEGFLALDGFLTLSLDSST